MRLSNARNIRWNKWSLGLRRQGKKKIVLEMFLSTQTICSLLEMVTSAPLMKTSMELQIPITLIKPNLDEIQSTFSQMLNNILETHKNIIMWGQRNTRKRNKSSIKFESNGASYSIFYTVLRFIYLGCRWIAELL